MEIDEWESLLTTAKYQNDYCRHTVSSSDRRETQEVIFSYAC